MLLLLFHQVTGIIIFPGMHYRAYFGFFVSFWVLFPPHLFLGKSFVSWLAARVFVCVFRSFVWGLVG